MPAPESSSSLLIDAVAIPAWLEADRVTPYPQRLHRDHAIGAEIGAGSPLARVRAWRRRLAMNDPALASPALAARVEHARRVITLVLILLGLFTGAGAASAVFHYTGEWPVNVVTVLATFVLLQLLLVAFTLVLMLPQTPGVRSIQRVLGGLNPGALAAAAYRRLRQATNPHAALLVWTEARGPAAARFARWQMLAWSQSAALAFNLAVLATAAALIAFTDLAFGWSTTLRVDSAAALRIAHTISAPWRDLWPDAAPDAALIEHSRFFRLASAPPSATSAEALTGWWPFLLAAILTYGLLPRCVLLIVALLRLRAATAQLLLDDPQVAALLDRMSAAEVQLGALEPETPRIAGEARTPAAPKGARGAAAAVVWSSALPMNAVAQWAHERLGVHVTQSLEAGGGRDLDADAATTQALAALRPTTVLVLVRAWEAPLLDLQDFLSLVREAVGPQCSIVLAPVGPQAQAPTSEQEAIWSKWAARSADPALYLESGA